MGAAKTKIKDWLTITKIRILNFIGEHKYVSALIGILLLSFIVFLIVRAATDETISNATARVDNLLVSTESDDADDTSIAPNYSQVTYNLHYTLQDSNQCTEEGVVYSSDEVTIVATLPEGTDTNNIKWLGADENASYEISSDGRVLTVKVEGVNVCSGQSQIFVLSILNAEKDTEITPRVTIKGGSNSQTVNVDNVSSITTYYDKEYSLIPKVVSGVASRLNDNGDRDAKFGIMLGINVNSNDDEISLKGVHLKTSADLTMYATQDGDDTITLYTENTDLFNDNAFDGNYFGINASSRYYFASDVLPDLTSTSGRITAFSRLASTDATYGTVSTSATTASLVLKNAQDVEIEQYPTETTYRLEALDSSTLALILGDQLIQAPYYSEEVYQNDTLKEDNEIYLNEIGEYEIRYTSLIGNDSITGVTMVKNVSVVEPQSENYSLIGTKTVYVTTGSTYSDSGLYDRSTGQVVNASLYTITYLKEDGTETSLSDLVNEPGEYQVKYSMSQTDEEIIRTIIVADEAPSNTSDTLLVKTVNKYIDETSNDHTITIAGNEVECNSENNCTYTTSEDGESEVYVVDNRSSKGYIAQVTKTINNIPYQYKMSINNIVSSGTLQKVSDEFYAIGAYYVTAKSVRSSTSSSTFDIKLTVLLDDQSSSAEVESKEYANGYETTSLTSSMYVEESSQYVKVDSSTKNGLYGDYYTAAMGEEVMLESVFEYSPNADDDITELNITIPVDGNLIPISYSTEVSDNTYFYLSAVYNNSEIEAMPSYTIEYCSSSGSCIAPEEFDRDEFTVSTIKITILPNENKTFEMKPGTVFTVRTKYEVRTYSSTSDYASDLSNLKFSSSATFSWNNGSETLTKESTAQDVYITPYKSRTTINIGTENNYSSAETVILDASKNDNYTVYTTLDVVSPAMDIYSNIFGYNRLDNYTIRFELPAGINYVYNNDYEVTPTITYSGDTTILTYTYSSVEPNSWIEPIYFDFNVDVTAVTGDIQIKVSSGDVSGNDYSINNDVSSIDKYKTQTKNIRIVNTEPVSYGQYVYSDGKYVSNISKDESFDFSTKLYNNGIPSTNDVTDIDVYTILPYTDELNGSSYSGGITLSGLSSSMMCTSSDPSLLASESLKDSVVWESCDNFKSGTTYSGLTAFKVHYDSLSVASSKTNTIKVHTSGNAADDVYTFKSYLEYQNADGTSSGYINFKDVKLEVISKKITGVVWEDFNVDGIMDDDEKRIDSVTLNLYNSSDTLIASTTPNEDGEYTFSALDEGEYYIVAEFNTEKYGVTGRPSADFYDETRLSAFYEELIDAAIIEDEEDQEDDDENLDDEEEAESSENEDETEEEDAIQQVSVVRTDLITVNSETRIIRNINLGLSLRKTFSVQINKYITRAEVTNALGVVTTYEYGNVKLAKLNVKDMSNLSIKVVYTIELQNVKYYPGYVTLITEEVPDGMSFNASYAENEGWELNEDGTLTNTTLADDLIYENEKRYLTVAFDITRKEAGSFVNYVSVDGLEILGGTEDE